MIKKNYLIKNRKDSEIIFNDILKIYKKIEKVKKQSDDNIVGILFHELMYFFVSIRCRRNLKIFTDISSNYPVIKFGKRNGIDIFKLKQSSFLVKKLLKFYSLFSYFFKKKKKLFLSKSISLSFKNKILIILFCLINKYEIVLVNFEDIKMNLSQNTESYFLKEIKKLLLKNKINLKNLDDIKKLIKKIKAKKEFKFENLDESIIISGTLGDIQNRLLAKKKKKLNSKLLLINHIPTYGVVSYKSLKYDEFYLCDYFLTSGKKEKILNDENYVSIDDSNYKIIPIENKNSIHLSNYIKKINFKELNKMRILYIPHRVLNVSLNGVDYLYKEKYEAWQNFLYSKFGKIDAKYPYKKINYNINNKFNVLDTNLKLLKICKNYDLIIIDYISSATFSEVAGTCVPILYFNLNRDNINKDAYKLIKNRVNEIKINIFDEFKGFDKINELKTYGKRRNKFKTTYLDTLTNKSLYHHLKNIEKAIKK
ncbi:hypothetical protein [Candidatus Pelagibacter sp. RS40]|uniref:hypothetical protein n=1 Tax=Candidatus Pelagibacter sp. RS40 TaxID=1977865 RepID=UPI000A14A535|nr:hypothetical protein [Candidatus Pelagibacter sp. RS40]ARJ49237.1 hypothetical protein B8063_04260 [Candidatus Pelagibacter sp. RS40]